MPSKLWPLTGWVVALYATISLSVVYVAATQFDLYDPATGGRLYDSASYARMADGVPLTEIQKPFRYRVVVPFLAGMFPRSIGSGLTSEQHTQVAFGIVNMVALTVAAWALFATVRHLGLGDGYGVVAGLLFYGSWVVLRFGGAVLVDAGGYAVLAAAAYAAVTRRHWLLAAVFTVGMFVKETTVLALLLIAVLDNPRRTKIVQALLCLPGLVAYVLIRLVVLPTDDGISYTPELALAGVTRLGRLSEAAHAGFEIFLTFGPLWVLAVLGVRHAGRYLPRRTAWVAATTLATPFLINSNYARIVFLAFPVVIPFAALGLSRFTRAQPA